MRLARDLDIADQLLHRQRVHQVVGQVGEVIHAIGERDHLLPGLDLAFLLDPGVQKTDVGNSRQDGLAIQLQHDAKHAVRRGMLRPHVERHAPHAARRRRVPRTFRFFRRDRVRVHR